MMQSYTLANIGKNQGAPRIWIEGRNLAQAGFLPGMRYDIVVTEAALELRANPDGSRIVSRKKVGDLFNPVIDINSNELLAMFDGMASLRIAAHAHKLYLMPLASEVNRLERIGRLRAKLESGRPLDVGSLSHGGGVLSLAVHSGFAEAGAPVRLAFANEIRPELLEHAARRNGAWSEGTAALAAPMQELAFDEWAMAHLPKLDIIEMGGFD